MKKSSKRPKTRVGIYMIPVRHGELDIEKKKKERNLVLNTKNSFVTPKRRNLLRIV
jgi:hypothetical protein